MINSSNISIHLPVFFHIIIFSQASPDYQDTERCTQFFTLSCYFFKMDFMFLQHYHAKIILLWLATNSYLYGVMPYSAKQWWANLMNQEQLIRQSLPAQMYTSKNNY